MTTLTELEQRLAALEDRIGPAPQAVAPITIGELTDVPAPGSPIASQWAQEVSARIVHRFATAAARNAAFSSPAKGTLTYLATGDHTEGYEQWDGVAWRRPWNMPWGSVSAVSNAASLTTAAGTESIMMACPPFPAPGARRVKITVDLTGVGTVAGDIYRFTVRRGAVVAGALVKIGPQWSVPGANYQGAFTIVAYDTPPVTAAMQYCAGVSRNAGTGAFTLIDGSTLGNNMWVEDLGPAPSLAPTLLPADDVAAPR